MKILLIEDHIDIANVIFDFFELKGHELEHSYNGAQGLQLAINNYYDVLIIDISLPVMDGLTVCRQLREAGHDTPVLFLTAHDQNEDVLLGFRSGADDYLAKPFDLNILEARLQALYNRRMGKVALKNLMYGELMLNLTDRTVTRGDQTHTLNLAQFSILKLLMMRAPDITTRKEIIQEIWGEEDGGSDTIRNHVCILRRLIDRSFAVKYIETIPKVGYKLTDLKD